MAPALSAIETLEHRVAFAGRDAGPGVLDPHERPARCRMERDAHVAARRCELDRVVREIAECLEQQRAIAVNAVDLVFGGRSVVGALTGTVADNEETLAFARLQNVRPMIETFPLEQAQAAYDRMMRADVRFRAVLTMNSAHTGASA